MIAASVIICCYTMDRWDLTLRSVESVAKQTVQPMEVIICVDHNGPLKERLFTHFGLFNIGLPLRIIENAGDGHLGDARNTAARVAHGELLVFLDDDAEAEADWLANLLAAYDDQSGDGDVVMVGGRPVPNFETRRPRWFPYEFDWVFGCAYKGLPVDRAPLAHLIGATMSVWRPAFLRVGGCHSDNHDDMDLCHRVAQAYPNRNILFEPEAVVHHFVSAERVTWRYFYRRCFLVNKGKVEAFRNMGHAANLGSETAFVRKALTGGLVSYGGEVVRGDPWAILRAAAMVTGIALAGAGHLAGLASLKGWSK